MKKYSLAFLALVTTLAACEDAVVNSSTSTATAPASFAQSVQDGYLPGADAGVQLYYRVYGSGPDTTVVVTGGPGLAMGYMDQDLTALTHGRTVIYYDARGAGRSTLLYDPAQLGMDRHVADLEAVRQFFGIGELSILGHSWGAMVAPFYAAQYPSNVDRLVMVTPGPVQAQYDAMFEAERIARTAPEVLQRQGELFGELASGMSPDPVAACEELLSIWFPAYFYDPANLANFQGSWCDVPPAAANALLLSLVAGRGSLGTNFDLVPMLQTLQVPALVIHGSHDPIPFASTQAYADAMPNGELLVIENAGHFPWLEQPTAFFTAVNTFLRRGDL
ncbi:MAG TPA: alpha/beta hydrolase [Longimicrobium sp.]|nr:alpha/beta hydrolase [Longimicrobium sp.]